MSFVVYKSSSKQTIRDMTTEDMLQFIAIVLKEKCL
jgi:hypothetical protein